MKLGRPVYIQLLIDKCSTMCLTLKSAKHTPVRHSMWILCTLKLVKGNPVSSGTWLCKTLLSRTSVPNDTFQSFLGFTCSIPHFTNNLSGAKPESLQQFAHISGLHSQIYSLTWGPHAKEQCPWLLSIFKRMIQTQNKVGHENIEHAPKSSRRDERESSLKQHN